MKVVKTVKYKKDFNFLGAVQFILGAFIVICFGISLIPFKVDEIYFILLALIIVQMLISLLRFNILNFVLEIFLLTLAVTSILPVLGYIPRVIGILAALLDMATFSSHSMSKQVVIKKYVKKEDENTTLKRKKSSKSDVKEAKFKEK